VNVGQIVRPGVSAARFGLELGDAQAGWLVSASGGDPEGVVVSEPGADGVIRKRIGSVRYPDIELSVNTGLSKQLSEWLAGTIGRKHVAKNGAVLVFDFNLKEASRLEFVNALIREVTFPALDGASKEAVKLAIKVAPESTKRKMGSGAQVTATPQQAGKRVGLASNFRLSIDGLDCNRVSKIGPITIRQKIVETRVGGHVVLEPGGLEIGELVIAVASVDGDPFFAWHKALVVDGNPSAEKKGELELLGPDMKTVLLTLTFAGLGIFNLEPEYVGTERVSRLRASMYCEEVGLTVPDHSVL
jgi:hypothetical protein